MKKPELLSPAGSLEKLKMAVLYGADAVYLAGERFGLRVAAENFTNDELLEGIAFAHERGRKVYVTLNILPHEEELSLLPEFLRFLEKAGADAVIVADLGVFSLVQEVIPKMPIHISTQASTMNSRAAKMWARLGASRIITAREMTLSEIGAMRKALPGEVSIEAFVHGAMCMAFSGRCLMSSYMTGRSANRGACAQPCRWKYALMEEKRPGEYFPIDENENGSFILNSKDLCMLPYIPELIAAGVDSFKIEGRVKSAYYAAMVTRAYRRAIDAYFEDPEGYALNPEWLVDVQKVSHREYSTGFFFGNPMEEGQIYKSSSYIRDYEIVGMVLDYDPETKTALIEQRNRFFEGEEIEIISPDRETVRLTVKGMTDGEGQPITSAPHPQMLLRIPVQALVKKDDIVCKMTA